MFSEVRIPVSNNETLMGERQYQERRQQQKALTNDQITADKVRLINEKGEQVGIVTNAEAQAAAEAVGMDLVMMAENDPPVCKIMDYGKHVFESKKQKAAQRKRAKRTQICLLYTSPSPRDYAASRMPSSA